MELIETKEIKELLNKAIWTKEEAIEKLKTIIINNENEQKRINESYNAQIDILYTKIEECTSIDQKEKLFEQAIELRKKVRNTQVNNNSILSAVGELNRMHGFNQQELTIKHDEEFEIDKKLAKMSVEELTAMLKNKDGQ